MGAHQISYFAACIYIYQQVLNIIIANLEVMHCGNERKAKFSWSFTFPQCIKSVPLSKSYGIEQYTF